MRDARTIRELTHNENSAISQLSLIHSEVFNQ